MRFARADCSFSGIFCFCPPKIGHPPKFAPKISKKSPNASSNLPLKLAGYVAGKPADAIVM